MTRNILSQLVLMSLILLFAAQLQAKPSLEQGRSLLQLTLQDTDMAVYTYRPQCENPDILFVFHGIKRTAKKYRNRAIPIADAACLVLFAPKFDKARFPSWRYQRAGVSHKEQMKKRKHWTAPFVHDLIKQARKLVPNQTAKVYMFGHSAGAQFLSRLAAYTPFSEDHIGRMVIANPSAHVLANLKEAAPYGFGGLGNTFSEFETYATLKAYLASPITIYLGQADTGDKYLNQSAPAKRQGEHRLARGRYAFREAQAMAEQKGWTFNWRLVEVPEVGHSSKKMLKALQLHTALDLAARAAADTAEAVGQ